MKNSILASGGLVIGFNILESCKQASKQEMLAMPKAWFNINSYLKIGDNGVVTIYTPNPKFGQNVMTSMPMIVAEELDADWKMVMVKMAMHDPTKYPDAMFGQFTGGSRGIMSKWEPLRNAGAAAKQMLKEAAAQTWQVPAAEITTEAGVLKHEKSGKSAGYGEMAAAASKIPVPEKPTLKEIKDFKLISQSQKNVRGKEIVTGQRPHRIPAGAAETGQGKPRRRKERLRPWPLRRGAGIGA